jgi:hypothetical protein
MKKLRIIIFILFQTTMFCFACEEKQFVLSQEDDAWLGKHLNDFLTSERPQRDIASWVRRTADYVKLIHEGSAYLQKHIDHAKNWLHYFNQKRELNTNEQIKFCQKLGNSAMYTSMLVGWNDNLETRIFLELLPLGMDIKSFSSSCICERLRSNANIMNGFIYFYKPSLDFFLEKKSAQKYSSIVTRMKFWDERRIFLRTVFTPTLYELTGDKVIRNTYKKVQDVVCKKRTAETFLLVLKVNKINMPRPVREGLILKRAGISTQEISTSYKSAIEFNAYCSHVEEEISKQIERIQKNDPEYYEKTLAPIPFLKTPEAFKKWYEELKFPKEEK